MSEVLFNSDTPLSFFFLLCPSRVPPYPPRRQESRVAPSSPVSPPGKIQYPSYVASPIFSSGIFKFDRPAPPSPFLISFFFLFEIGPASVHHPRPMKAPREGYVFTFPGGESFSLSLHFVSEAFSLRTKSIRSLCFRAMSISPSSVQYREKLTFLSLPLTLFSVPDAITRSAVDDGNTIDPKIPSIDFLPSPRHFTIFPHRRAG